MFACLSIPCKLLLLYYPSEGGRVCWGLSLSTSNLIYINLYWIYSTFIFCFQINCTKPDTKPLHRELQIYNATVKMGADGTDDDVTVGICSDSKTDCCQKKLSRTLSDDWKKNKVSTLNIHSGDTSSWAQCLHGLWLNSPPFQVENWKKDKFGDCGKDGKIYREANDC